MKQLEDYLKLPYTIILRRDEDGDMVVRVDELPGCAAHGKTSKEALERLEEVKALWIADCLERGDQVPEPADDDALPSGKWVQRVPRTLHRKLVQLAEREKVSLNQLVTSVLAEAVGVRRYLQSPDARIHPKPNWIINWTSSEPSGLDDMFRVYRIQRGRLIASKRVLTKETPRRQQSYYGLLARLRTGLPNEFEVKKANYGDKKEIIHEHE